MARLADKTVFITGAGSGIGKAQAILFAKEGATIIAGDLNAAAAQETADEILTAGGRALAVGVDVADEASVQAAATAAMIEFGRIHILCNTAGAFDKFAQALDTSRELWDRVVAVNLTSLYITANVFLPHMIEMGGGVVLTIASGAGLRGGGGGASYTSTKHAAVGFTKQLAAAYGHQGIRANAIAPGLIDTPMVSDFSADAATVKGLAAHPAGRIGTVADIANASLFLVSDEADFIHAVTLPVDGGLVETF